MDVARPVASASISAMRALAGLSSPLAAGMAASAEWGISDTGPPGDACAETRRDPIRYGKSQAGSTWREQRASGELGLQVLR